MHWLTASLIGMAGISPLFLLTRVAQQHFGMEPDVTAFLWMVATTLGIGAWVVMNGRGHELVVLSNVRLAVFVFALTAGAAANLFLFYALSVAPNPGLVVGVFNANAVLAFLLAPVLALCWPQFFPSWEFSAIKGLGIGFVICGLYLISK